MEQVKGLLNNRLSLGSYPGGKSDKQKHLPLYLSTPSRISTLIEPFAGLASFTIINSPKTGRAVLNDIDPEVVAFLKCINDRELLNSLKQEVSRIYPVTKEDYYEWKRREPKTVLELATRRVVFQNCSFSGAGGGYSREKAGRKWHVNRPKTWEKVHVIFRNLDVEIHNSPFTEFVETVVDSHSENSLGDAPLVYLDPPYYKVAEDGALYNYNSMDLDELLDVLRTLDDVEMHWIMSNRDHPHVREVFSDYYQLGYSTYNDMGNKRDANPELLVSNHQLKT